MLTNINNFIFMILNFFLINVNVLVYKVIDYLSFVVYIFFLFLRIFHKEKVKISVNKLRLFSKRVSAKIFPMVLNPKIKRKIHKMIFTTFDGISLCTYSPLINNTYARKRFIRIDMLSNKYISASFLSFPPQVIS